MQHFACTIALPSFCVMGFFFMAHHVVNRAAQGNKTACYIIKEKCLTAMPWQSGNTWPGGHVNGMALSLPIEMSCHGLRLQG